MVSSKLAGARETIMKRLVLLTCIVGPALVMTATGHSGVWAPIQQKAGLSSSSASIMNDGSREVEVVTITPDGFQPQEIVRPAGAFLLSVTNRSGVDSLSVRIETEQHGRLREKLLPLHTPYWREVINPPPGRYIITEANHPDWTLSVIVQ